MFRQGIRGFLLLLSITSFSSCGMAQILGLPRQEAAELLRKGDIGFIRQSISAQAAAGFSEMIPRLKQLEGIHPAASFYAGLLAGVHREKETENFITEILLFCAALESPSLPARQEAANKLIPLILRSGAGEAKAVLGFLNDNLKRNTDALRSACLYRLGQYSEAEKNLASSYNAGKWEKALLLFAAWKASSVKTNREEILGFLFELAPGELRSWAYTEAFSSEGLLDPDEQIVLSGRLSSEILLPDGKLTENFQTTLNNLRSVLLNESIIFFRYPELISDLGRAYLYVPARREEGIKLFTSWDLLLETGTSEAIEPEGNIGKSGSAELRNFIKSLGSDEIRSRRYRLLYYAGRIERARERYAESSAYFSRALDFAPDSLQSDACIWYMLMNTLAKDPAAAARLTLSTMSRWNDVSYFDDVLDRLSAYLTGKRQWTSLLEIFSLLKNMTRSAAGTSMSGASLSQYAWILGRAVQEGYLKTKLSAKDFFRIAFEEGNGSFYYRAMAASKLGETFVPEDSKSKAETTVTAKTGDEETEFLLGFFECGAVSFVLPYIQAAEGDLSVPRLRRIAEALGNSDKWKESLNFISRYIRREDYRISREDLYLFYPRPFQTLIEKYAREAKLGAEILYGLIRTESYFMPDAVSRSGAIGLAQLLPPTASDMAGRIARRGGPDYRNPGGVDLKNPDINIHIGSFYLRYLSDQTGSPMLALLAYNGGLGRTRRWYNLDRRQKDGGLPQDLFLETIEYSETREYGRRVLAAAAVYGYLYYDMSMEAVAADIYR